MSRLVVDGLRWEVRARGTGRPLLLIHGFTGRGTSWGDHAGAFARSFRTIVVDLPGHGRTRLPADARRASVECAADDLATILRRLDAAPPHVVGYSLGARIALRLAIAHPDAVERLVLESPSAGIADASCARERRAADDALADRIERDGIPAFVADWEAQPIFASQAALPPARAARIRRIRLANRPDGPRRQPARRRPGRDGAARRSAGRGPRPDAGDRRRPRRRRPTRASSRSPPASPCPARRRRRRRATRPTTSGPLAFRRLALDFLQEDAA